MNLGLETLGEEHLGLAGAKRGWLWQRERTRERETESEQARVPLGESSTVWWNEAGSALTQPLARVHQSGRRSCQPSPADGHVHVLGPCPGWTALLTGCGLWSPRAGSGGSTVLIWPGLD